MDCDNIVIDDPDDFENANVHKIYSQIARHFSDTRYKPWPVVESFLKSIPKGSIGSDFGCGNGKYIELNKDLFYLGNDRCEELLSIAHKKRLKSDFFIADMLYIPLRHSSLDFAISIAVIHHFSTLERRRLALTEIERTLRPGGKFLVFVWAMEQKGRRKFNQQNSLVSWELPSRYQNKEIDNKIQSNGNDLSSSPIQKLDRFYHLFCKGELDELVNSVSSLRIIYSGYDRDNWYIIGEKITTAVNY